MSHHHTNPLLIVEIEPKNTHRQSKAKHASNDWGNGINLQSIKKREEEEDDDEIHTKTR